MTDIVMFIIFGLIVGFVGGYAGIGGAPFLVIIMTVIYGVSQHTAQGTVLAVMLGPMSLLGIIAMKDKIKRNLKYAVVGVIAYAVFSYIGAYFAFLIESNRLQIVFSIFIFLLGINEILGVFSMDKPKHQSSEIPFLYIATVGVFVGIVGGFFGIGAGVLMTPIFMNLFGMHKDDARTLSLMILLPPVSIGAVIKYQSEDAILWVGAIIIFASYFITNYFGSRFARNHSTKVFKKVYGYILIAISIVNLLTI